MRSGGLLYIEGDRRFLKETVAYIRQALEGEGRLFELPVSHPIYHSFYDFDCGFFGVTTRECRTQTQVPDTVERNWSHPYSVGRLDKGLWGVEVDGELAVVLSGLGLFSHWQPDVVFVADEDDEEEVERPVKTPQLQAGTNIIVYAVNRP